MEQTGVRFSLPAQRNVPIVHRLVFVLQSDVRDVDKSGDMCIKDSAFGAPAATDSHLSVGILGEQIAVNFLIKKGFSILRRNVRLRGGELDIVAQKDDVLHFVEVKTGSVRVWQRQGADTHTPEGHMHGMKCARMARAIEQYRLRYDVPNGMRWTADLIVVLVHTTDHAAKVRVLPNIILK